MFYEVLMEKRASALSKYVRRLSAAGKHDEAADALYNTMMRRGGSSLQANELRNLVRRDVGEALNATRADLRNARTWEDYVPRTVNGEVNPTYLQAMRQMRRGAKRDRVGMISGGTTEGFDHMLRGGVASNMPAHSPHLQDAAPGINLSRSGRGVWTVPRARGGDSRGMDLYAAARGQFTRTPESPSIMQFDLPKALVRDEKGLRNLQAQGKFMGGGSTGGVEYMIPGPVVDKFGRNFRQNKIVAESHPALARRQATGNLYSESKLPESLRHRAGPRPSKRATDLPWARSERFNRGGKNRRMPYEQQGLNEQEVNLALSIPRKGPIDPFMANLEEVRVDALPKKMKKRLRAADWSDVEDFGDDDYPGATSFLSALRDK